MDDLISRQMLLEYIHGEPVGRLLCDKYNLDGLIEQLPSAQPRGKWLPTSDDNKKRCSECDVITLIAQYPFGEANFCPNCGAKMEVNNESN